MQVGNHVVTQKSLYIGLLVIGRASPCYDRSRAGLLLLWFAQPFALVFWLVCSSSIVILGHAACIEPPVSSEYGGLEVRSPCARR